MDAPAATCTERLEVFAVPSMAQSGASAVPGEGRAGFGDRVEQVQAE